VNTKEADSIQIPSAWLQISKENFTVAKKLPIIRKLYFLFPTRDGEAR
jgi:hypothetical protein